MRPQSLKQGTSGASSDWANLPAPDEVELHVFGPGYGECLLVHLGEGEWLIVDSCKRGRTQGSSALSWMSEAGIAPEAVRLIVATHWHDDHVRGLAETFAACPNAKFVCSGALLGEEALALVCDSESATMRVSSGVDEMRRIVSELQQRKKKGNVGLPFEFAGSGKLLFRRDAPVACEVWSLSPSSSEEQRALTQLVQAFDTEERVRDRVGSCRPNSTAVVLWVRVANRTLLLGADLEEQGAPDVGWSAIIESATRMPPAEAFKVAHHGSKTAHHDAVWPELLKRDPVAV